jgi:gentisate 1,2-dioxygenase
MAVATSQKTSAAAPPPSQHPALSAKAREMMEQLNADAAKLNIWVRTQANSPAQRPWFTDTDGGAAQQLTEGRVGAGRLKTLPYHWAWKDYRPYLDRISEIARKADVSPIEFADRQSILLTNPGLQGRLQVTNTIRCAISIYNPGDLAPAHLHSPNASRTILSEKGGYTNVEGERCEAARGDLILTPNGTWHDHGIEPGGTQCIWQDGLDIPLMNSLDANFYEVHPDIVQKPAPLSRENWQKPYSPVFRYGWDESYAALKETGSHSPYEGTVYEYRNPLTGGPIMPTIGAQLQRLAPGEQTRPHRHTGSVIYQVAKGRGWSVIAGQRFEWEEKDIFALPSWALHSHGNASATDDAVLFSFNDIPAMNALALYREATQ